MVLWFLVAALLVATLCAAVRLDGRCAWPAPLCAVSRGPGTAPVPMAGA